MLVGVCLVTFLASSAAASGPPTEHVARGACPFECCAYRTWTVEKDTVLRASPDVRARVMGRLKAGSRVDAITGEVHARPVRFVVTAAHERYTPGDELWVYSYLGEGRFTVWRHEAMYEEDLGFSPHGGSPGARCENRAECWGRLDSGLRVTSWVKLRSTDGREGWSNQAEHFGDKDACAASAADEPPAEVLAVLDAHFPGWRFARVRPDVARQMGPGDTPRWLAGDFDGDGRVDHAVQVVRLSVPSEQAQAVVAIRAATRRPEVLHAIPESQAAYLRLARRGERVPDVGTDVERRRTVVLQTDGVHVLFGQEAGITCVWRAGAFGCFVSGD